MKTRDVHQPKPCQAAARHNYTKLAVKDCPQCQLVADGEMCPRHAFLLAHGITRPQRKPRAERRRA